MISLRVLIPSFLAVFFMAACGQDLTLPNPASRAVQYGDAFTAGDVVAGSYIVAFRAPSQSARRKHASFLAESRYHTSYLQESFLSDPKVKSLRFITTLDLANPQFADGSADFAPPPALQMAFTENRLDDLSAALARVDFVDELASHELLGKWEEEGRIWYAEPNYVNRLLENPYTKELSESYKSANLHWHGSIRLMAALENLAKKDIQSADAPVVAVLDSGVDVEHPSLKNRMWVNPSPGASGCPDDVHGCDTTVANKDYLGSGDVSPYLTGGYSTDCPFADATESDTASRAERGVCGHGTHVAGIIAAELGSGAGGVCPVCQIMAIKIIKSIDGKGVASDDAILNGFKYLTLFGTSQKIVRVANSSFGKYVRSRSVALLVSILKKKPFELLVVGAAGNDDSMARGYPAALNDAIAVASVNSQDGKAKYSNFGPWVDVSAPGGEITVDQGIFSTVPGGKIDAKQGTSMAAPVVSGVAGLILSVDPGRSFSTLRSSIVDTADCRLYAPEANGGINRNSYYPKVEGETSRRPLLGSGIVDVAAALENTVRSDCEGAAVQRVNRNCGVLAPGRSSFPGFLVFFFCLPLLPGVWVRRSKRP